MNIEMLERVIALGRRSIMESKETQDVAATAGAQADAEAECRTDCCVCCCCDTEEECSMEE